jgi:hypothetical protein
VPEPSPLLLLRSRDNNAGHGAAEDLLTQMMLARGEIPDGGLETPPPDAPLRPDDNSNDNDNNGDDEPGSKAKKGAGSKARRRNKVDAGDVPLGADPRQLAQQIDDSLEMLRYLARGTGTAPKLDVQPSLFDM